MSVREPGDLCTPFATRVSTARHRTHNSLRVDNDNPITFSEQDPAKLIKSTDAKTNARHFMS